jgi:drug/metabolite transporter (DMT)-like permease
MSKLHVWGLLILCNLFWAGNYVFGKFVIAEMTPLEITFFRWLLALFLLYPVALKLEKPVNRNIIRRDWLLLLGMGILGGIAYNLVLYSALAYTTATNAALVNAINPGFIVLFSVLLFKERVSRLQWLGFVLSLLGALVVLTGGDVSRLLLAQYNAGDLLMVAAVLVWTFYTLLARKITTPPITATTISTAMAVLLMTPWVLYQGAVPAAMSSLTVTGMLYIVIFPSVGSFIFWNLAVREVGASKAGIFLNLMPVFAALISVLLGEQLTAAQGLGGLLVFCGVYLTTGLLERKTPLLQNS